MAVATAHVVISGLVQGVYFRDSTRRRAEQLGVNGWVRNLPDGRVEAVFEGEREDVEAIIAWTHQGPPGAQVENVAVDWRETGGTSGSFEIRW